MSVRTAASNTRVIAGQTVLHGRRRTLTQQDNTWFTLLTLNTAPHFDITAPSFEQFGGVLMNSCVTLGVVQGLCLPELGDLLLPNRGFGEVRMTSPVFAGDTLSATSEVISCDEDEHGANTLRTRTSGLNQDGVTVIQFERSWIQADSRAWAREKHRRVESAPVLAPDRNFTPRSGPPVFADFQPGHRYNHGFGRTMLAPENIWYSLLHHNCNPFYTDAEFARAAGMPNLLVDDTFVLSTVVGMGVKHTTEKALANLGWRNIVFHTPVFCGDTLFSETEIIGKRESASRPGQGIVSVTTTGRNQKGEVVLTFDRSFLFSL